MGRWLEGDTTLRREINPDKIKERREDLAMSLWDLSIKIFKMSGVKISPQTISQWENGKIYPTTKRMKLLADALGVKESYFDAKRSTSQIDR